MPKLLKHNELVTFVNFGKSMSTVEFVNCANFINCMNSKYFINVLGFVKLVTSFKNQLDFVNIL